MLYTAPMSKPARKPRLPEPVGLAIAIVERVTGETLVARPKTSVKEAVAKPRKESATAATFAKDDGTHGESQQG